MQNHSIVIKLACALFRLSETCYRYQAKLRDENATIAGWLLRLTAAHRSGGFGMCFYFLRNVKRFGWNHKRLLRIYRELELNLRIKPKKRLKRDKPTALAVPELINQCWSMDFMHDQLEDGRSFRLLNQVIEWRGKPKQIRSDNGPEYISALLAEWAEKHDVELKLIQSGNPQQNAYVERYNRTVRYEWLN